MTMTLRQQVSECVLGSVTQLDLTILTPEADSILIALVAADVPSGVTTLTGGGRVWTKVQDELSVNVGTEIWYTTDTTNPSSTTLVRLTFSTSDTYCAEILEITNAERTHVEVYEWADNDTALLAPALVGTRSYQILTAVVGIIDEQTGTFGSWTGGFTAGLLHNNNHGLATKTTAYKFTDAGVATTQGTVEYSSTAADYVIAVVHIRDAGPPEILVTSGLFGGL